MFIYIPISMPISWMIDTLGYYKSVSIGQASWQSLACCAGIGRELYLGIHLHNGIGCLPTLHAELNQHGGRQMVPHERARNGGWDGV